MDFLSESLKGRLLFAIPKKGELQKPASALGEAFQMLMFW